MDKKSVGIIGAGYSGLSAACYLARAGCSVTIYEKNETIGGRARSYSAEGFTYDMGPSWYWMPDVFERFFADFGKKVSDYYELKRLSPSYRVYFENEAVDMPATLPELYALFERIEPGSSANLEKFLKEAEYKYNVGMKKLTYKPGVSIGELLDPALLSGLLRLEVFTSISRHIRKLFRDERLIRILEFPVLFLGALPAKTPALYSLMNYADLVLGTWYPMGGMQKIAESMRSLAAELGVEFKTGKPVSHINVKNGLAHTLSAGGEFRHNAVVSSADYHFTESILLEKQYRQYSPAYWESRKMAPSCLIYYLGIRGKVDKMLHHNLFFDESFAKHAGEIYNNPAWPEAPLFYVCCPGKSDPGLAPAGCENLFILIPVAPGLTDTEDIRQKYFELVVKRILQKTGTDISENILHFRSYAPTDFSRDYNAFKGNAYGLANTLTQTAHLKPSIRNKKVKNLFYAGQLTVPGPGVPPALISGKLASEQVMNFLKS